MRRPEGMGHERVLPVQHRVRPPGERPGEELGIAARADQVAPEVRQHRNREEGERDGEVRDAGRECLPSSASGSTSPRPILRSRDERHRPNGTEPDRLPACRGCPHLPVQLAVRAAARRRVPAADREHGHEPRGRRGDRADPGFASLARDRLGRPGHLPARPDGRGAGLRRAPRRGRQGLPRRGR